MDNVFLFQIPNMGIHWVKENRITIINHSHYITLFVYDCILVWNSTVILDGSLSEYFLSSRLVIKTSSLPSPSLPFPPFFPFPFTFSVPVPHSLSLPFSFFFLLPFPSLSSLLPPSSPRPFFLFPHSFSLIFLPFFPFPLFLCKGNFLQQQFLIDTRNDTLLFKNIYILFTFLRIICVTSVE